MSEQLRSAEDVGYAVAMRWASTSDRACMRACGQIIRADRRALLETVAQMFERHGMETPGRTDFGCDAARLIRNFNPEEVAP